jgi:hypothetical protein
MRRTSAKGSAGVATAAVRKRTRRGKKLANDTSGPAEMPAAAQSQEEEVTSQEMTPVAVETTTTEDAEDREETPPEGEEWPG